MEDLSTYIFDFDAEVERLQRELGPLAARVVFVRVDEARRLSAPLCGSAVRRGGLQRLLAEIGEDYVSGLAKGSETSSLLAGAGRHVLSVIAIDAEETPMLGPEEAEIERFLTLVHEAGHAVHAEHDAGYGEKAGENAALWREGTADAYAAFKSVQRFGAAALPVLQRWSWFRAWRFAGDGGGVAREHMTSPVLDKIVADIAAGGGPRLTEEETIARARAYAGAWMPEARLFAAAAQALGEGGKMAIPARLDFLCSTCLSSENPLLFYAGVKALLPFAEGGVHLAQGGVLRLPEAAARRVRAAAGSPGAVRQLAALTAAFDASAPRGGPSVAQAAQTPVPKNKQHLSYVV